MPEPASATALEFQDAEKRFGVVVALRRLSLSVNRGEFVLLLGANGSGKTTLLRLGALLLRPSSGTVKFPGIEETISKARLGYVAHTTLLYDDLTANENLIFFARLYGIPDSHSRAAEWLDSCGLATRGTSLVRTFSRGMRQRLALARALLNNPQFLFLDEPATGLDRQGHAWLAATLSDLRSRGCTILMSAHSKSEAASLATRALLLDHGSLIADSASAGSVAEILARADAIAPLAAPGGAP
jgi:ABC-type multidrug transport system ATPase subunit